jgi:hypothetical protein
MEKRPQVENNTEWSEPNTQKDDRETKGTNNKVDKLTQSEDTLEVAEDSA